MIEKYSEHEFLIRCDFCDTEERIYTASNITETEKLAVGDGWKIIYCGDNHEHRCKYCKDI